MTKIKICGIRRMEDIEMMNRYRPDYIGYVFAKSKRQVTMKLAEELNQGLHRSIKRVGVFVNEKKENVASLLTRGIIDLAQLHGQEPEEEIRWLQRNTGRCIIKAITVTSEEKLQYVTNNPADYLLYDNGPGGTGQTFDWNMLQMNQRRFFLAGGISCENVRRAMQLDPYAIDVSSGVELDGFKDEKKVREIITIIRSLN